jgi:tocopherol O-methyltransferase
MELGLRGTIMIVCASVTKRSIRNHYDLATPLYRLLWGPHIHHGLWEAEEAPLLAQRRLIDRLGTAAALRPGEAVLDVGCGMGGSSIELARRYGCLVTGLTLSPVQRRWARFSAIWQRMGRRTSFLCGDAETVVLPSCSFDVVWNVECSEHFFDKPGFFRRAADWLRPGGRVALCAWLAGAPEGAAAAHAVCEGFLCPSLGTASDYQGWLTAAGLTPHMFADLTPQVMRTWEICDRRVRASGAGLLARCLGPTWRNFVERFATLHDAYQSGAMRYGLFVAEKGLESLSGE